MQLQNSLTGPGICVQEKKHQKAFKKKKIKGNWNNLCLSSMYFLA